MTKIYLDSNVILDLYIPGREGKAAARTLLDLQESSEGTIRLYLSFLSVADIAYVLRKQYDKAGLKKILQELFHFCNVLPMSDLFISEALESPCPDFEDALQICCAETADCDFLLTSNLRHYQGNTWITVLTPGQFLEKLQEQWANEGKQQV